MIITDVSLAADQLIIMISEGSCDTEDWSNDAENPVLTHRSKLQLKISKNNKEFFWIVIIFQNISFFTVFLIK